MVLSKNSTAIRKRHCCGMSVMNWVFLGQNMAVAGLCGACTIHLDGEAVRGCQTSVSDAAGKSVTTIEALNPKGDHPVQVAWRDQNVPQCGFCQSGQIMQAASLLAKKPNPTDQEILDAMSGNVCRCGCYQRIVTAVRQASTGA